MYSFEIPNIFSNPMSFATMLSIFVAIFFGFLGFRAGQYRQKVQHTFDLLKVIYENEGFREADFLAHKLILKGESIRYEEVDDETHKCLRSMLTFYQLLAHSVKNGISDRKTIEKFRSNSMSELYVVIQEFYLPELRRRNFNRHTLYDEFENMARNNLKNRR